MALAFPDGANEKGKNQNTNTTLSPQQLAEEAKTEGDEEMLAVAEGEMDGVRARIPDLESALLAELVPRDEADSRCAILEVRGCLAR